MRGVRERNQKLVAALTFPPAPPSAPPRGEKGGMSEAGAISRTRSPLSRNAGEGPGVRASRSAGEGPGVRGYGVSEAHLTRHAQRLALPARQRERAADGGTERWPSNAVVARARYIPNKQSGFLIIL